MSWKTVTLMVLASAQILAELFLLGLSKLGAAPDEHWQDELD